jgi:hypothetical protein
MPGRLGPRFAVEAAFLIVLAVGAALADLSPQWIVLIMGVGWILVGLFEFTADRLGSVFPPLQRYGLATPPEPEPVIEEEPMRAADAATMVVPANERADAKEEPHRKRRWFRRRRPVEPDEEAEETVVEPPRHVRLLPRDGSPGHDSDAERLPGAADQEERRR